jgi:hypothetical protein
MVGDAPLNPIASEPYPSPTRRAWGWPLLPHLLQPGLLVIVSVSCCLGPQGRSW